jgi:hypothetical protein
LPWVVFPLALALTLCVSPEELRREDEATCAGFGFHSGTDAFASCLQKGKSGPPLLGCAAGSVLGLGVFGTGVGAVFGLDSSQ